MSVSKKYVVRFFDGDVTLEEVVEAPNVMMAEALARGLLVTLFKRIPSRDGWRIKAVTYLRDE